MMKLAPLKLFEAARPVGGRQAAVRDALAGVTLASMNVPQLLGYARIAGMPLVTGLYTALLAPIAFAAFGSSRHLVVAADSGTAAILAGALRHLAEPGSAQYSSLAATTALLTAGMLLLARVFRLGFLADFLSRTVLVGFLTGVGIQVALGELPGLLGLEKHGHGLVAQLVSTFEQLPQTNLPSLYIVLAVLAIIIGFEKFVPRFPGALLAVIGMTAACAYFHWEQHGIRLVGTVPGGLPHLGL